MKTVKPEETLNGTEPEASLQALCAAYPQQWQKVRQNLASMVAGGHPEQMQQYLQALKMRQQRAAALGQAGRMHAPSLPSVEYRMACLAVRQHYVAVASGINSGKVRFNLLNGLLAQWLLFREGLERKPVSMLWFRLFWPLVWQKRMLMPLVQPEGIYCFYSQQLIDELVRLIAHRRCLEIAAGDGTLTRFLRDRGADVTATDDYSWEHAVRYPDGVSRMEAREALASHRPEVVICSWPPAANGFERQVFRTRSVCMYIVIASRHQHAAGNWKEYEEQVFFDFREEKRLSRLVLPPELDPAVYVFSRK